MPRFAATPLSLKARALRHLARREHSRAELERKLAAPTASTLRDRRQELGDDAAEPQDEALLREQIARTLDELAGLGLLSDERLAESLLAGRGQRFGSRHLKQRLQAKGLDAALVADTLQRARATEFERALALWQRRFGPEAICDAGAGGAAGAGAEPPAAAAAARARQMRFLAARGFDADTIRRVVKGETEG